MTTKIKSGVISDNAITSAHISSGAISSSHLTGIDTDAVSEGSSNLYFTTTRARTSLSVTDSGGDGSLTYDNSTGVITYTGPSAAEVRAHISVTDSGGDGSLAYSNGVITYVGPSASEVRAHLSAGTGVTYSSGEFSIGQSVATTASPTFADINITGDLNLTGDINSYSVTDLDIVDQTITLGVGQNEAASDGSGIIIAGSNASILWDEPNNEFDFNNPLHITTAALTTSRVTVEETSGATTSLKAGGSVGYVGTDSNHPLRIQTNAVTKIYVATDGKIGVGSNNTNPLQTVDISGSSAGLNLQGGNNRIYFSNYRALEGSTTGSLLQVGEGYDDIALQGNVGIGDTSPDAKLEIKQGSSNWYEGIRINRSDNTTQFGTFSNNSGATFISAADTTGGDNNVIVFGNSSDGTTFTERMRITSSGVVDIKSGGTASAPSLIFEGDTNTGLFHGTDTLGFSTAGSEAMRIDSSGNIGIGVTPDTLSSGYTGLQINGYAYLIGHSGGDHYMTNNAYFNSGWKYGQTSTAQKVELASGRITLMTAASGSADSAITWNTGLVQDSSGNVGIGISSPDADLHVEGVTRTKYLRFQNLTDATSEVAGMYSSSGGGTNDLSIYASALSSTSSNIKFLTAPTNSAATTTLFLEGSSGNVGIGTTSPQDRLHVTLDSATTNAEVEVMRVEATSSGTPVDGFGPFIDFRGDRQAGNPDSYGRIGFESDGMTSTTVDGAFIIQPAEDGNYTERMRVSSDGNVAIGGSTPMSKLQIESAPNSATASHYGRAEYAGLNLTIPNTVGAINQLIFSNAAAESYGYGGIGMIMTSGAGVGLADMVFTTKDTGSNAVSVERMRIDSSGNIGITSTASLRFNGTGDSSHAVGYDSVIDGSFIRGQNGVRVLTGTSGGTERVRFDTSGNIYAQSATQNRIVLGSTGGVGSINNSTNWIRGNSGSLQFNAASTGYVWESGGATRLAMTSTGVITQTTAGTSDSYDMILRSTDSGDPGLSITRDNVVGFGIAVRGATDDYVDFQVNNAGATSFSETGKLRLYHNGNVSIPGTALWSSGVGNTFGTTGNHYMIRSANSTGNESIIVSNTTSGGSIGILQYRISGGVQGQYLIGTSGSGITFTGSSDYRLKENVSTITESSLDKINQLRLVSYNWNDLSDMPTDTTEIGVIAHEIEEVFPEFVEGEKDAVYTQEELDARGDPETTNEEVGDIKAQTVSLVNKDMIIHILKGMQELKAENDSLKARIETLEG